MKLLWILACVGAVLAIGGLAWSWPHPSGTRRYRVGCTVALIGVALLTAVVVITYGALLADPYPTTLEPDHHLDHGER